jgi:probable HAF family extracellular repeat protein
MTRFNLSLAVLACSLATSSMATAADVRYRLTLLDPTLTAAADVRGLNNRGEVVGVDGHGHAFLWKEGQLTDLNAQLDPASPFSTAEDINDRSAVVGLYFDGLGRQHGYLLSRGTVTTPQVIGDRGVLPRAINKRGQVVGVAFDEQGQRHGFIWRRGEAELLEAPPAGTFPTPVAVNGRGVATGTSSTKDSFQSVIWKDGDAQFIGPESMGAIAINNREQVLLEPEFGPGIYALWEDGETRPLAALNGSLGTMLAFDIDNRGRVVGLCSMPDGSSAATLWRHEVPINLNERIDSSDPLRPFIRLVAARQINDRGQIVAQGVDSRSPNDALYYLLDPVH